ncbi:hypothetical protein [Mycobacterium sp. DL440]|uniref:hypothetical protein n=1 Tax=Mycobacterium sp. DL440 TaxID=2675523 RepID=UPI00142336D7|nr:hypothetical protein [Mycobacterium sp. DL440]
MISVEFECDHSGCNGYEGPRQPGPGEPPWAAEEAVDVYASDWHGNAVHSDGARLNEYLPEGWSVREHGDPYTGYALTYCPMHADEHPAQGPGQPR